MNKKGSESKEDTIKFFAEAPAHVYEIARQTNPLLQKCIDMARLYVESQKKTGQGSSILQMPPEAVK